MKYNSADAVQYLKDAVSNNEELTKAFDAASKALSTAFSESGDIVSGAVGTACSNCWGNGSADYFKNTTLVQIEKFLLDKVQPILEQANTYQSSTDSIYAASAEVDRC